MSLLTPHRPTTDLDAPRTDVPASAGRRRLVGGQTWLLAVELAGDRCECDGWCQHPACVRGRCHTRHSPAAPLHVIHTDPATTGGLPDDEVPLTDLAAVCRTCHDRWAEAALTDPTSVREGR